MIGRINSIGRSLDGKTMLMIETDVDAAELQDFTDKDLSITIKKYVKRRSLDANALLWAVLGELAAASQADKWDLYLLMLKRYGKYTYVSLKPEAVDDFRAMYRECEVVGESEDRVCMICYIGSSTYTKEEFSRLLDGVISECTEVGIKLKASSEIEELYRSWQKS